MRRTLAALATVFSLLMTMAQAATLDGRTLSFESDTGATIRTRTFAGALGELRGPVTQGDITWLGIGPELYSFDEDGHILGRLDFSGPIRALDEGAGSYLLTVTAGYPGVQDTYTVSNSNISGGEVRERVFLPPRLEVTNWLERAAQLATPAQVRQAVSLDPTNPFLALRHAELAQTQGDQTTALAEIERAARIEPLAFPAVLRLAARMEDLGQPLQADLLLRRAARDYLTRGYDPQVPVSREALRAYGDPLGTANKLLHGALLSTSPLSNTTPLDSAQLQRADVWLRYLRQISPRFEQSGEVYERYAALLEAHQNATPENTTAADWRTFARSLNAGTLYHLGPNALLKLQDAARLLCAALSLTIAASLALLLVRRWPLRDVEQARPRPASGDQLLIWQRPLWQLRRSVLGYAGLGEKLIVLSLLLALLLSLLAWNWTARTQAALSAPVLNRGTYGATWLYDTLANLYPGRDADLLRGLAAQLSEDEVQARRYYQQALDRARQRANTSQKYGIAQEYSTTLGCIQNNLGVIAQQQGDVAGAREQWRLARSTAPDLPSAAYNLGLAATSSLSKPSASHTPPPLYLPLRGQTLCYPDQRSLISVLGGNVSTEITLFVRRPWQQLLLVPTGLPPTWQWAWVISLLGLCLYAALMLLVPPLHAPQRFGTTLGGLPRSLTFRALAVLLPGSALLDGAWGGALLLSWATLSLLLSASWLHWPTLAYLSLPAPPLLLGLLVLIYVINLSTLVIKQWLYWRQLRHY